ncbi:RNA polymerase sigma factor SigJ [Ornithinimicrobium pratense]|uniref:RNA polymerase sigma factor SigJ n=1 Tax=Ornithinimicrobium pratense TaxID=2593973 RepID=UPI001EE304D4|nr:RNA polymerase sigma factor SigJ [Ornithinimicrobium pratense]
MATTTEQGELFTVHRSMVFAIAYEVLGTRADADDVVQETYLRWADVDISTVRDPRAYLATIATRTALNTVRTVSRRREAYPGTWLPEPLVSHHESPEQQLLMKEQLSYALSVLLQQATPEQRAVFMLHDVFGLPYPVIAKAVGKTQAAVRQIAHRARTRLTATDHAEGTTDDSAEVLEAFLAAVVTGDLQALMNVLAPQAVLLSDGGGKVVAALRPITGAEAVAAFLLKIARTPVPQMRVDIDTLNGGLGVLIRTGDRLELTVAVAVNDQRKITGVYLVRNPDKLRPARK